MSLVEKFELAQGETIRKKVRMASIIAAIQILSAPARAEEHRYCNLIIKEPDSEWWLDQLMYAVIASDIVEASSDIDIQIAVNSVIGRYAIAFNQPT